MKPHHFLLSCIICTALLTQFISSLPTERRDELSSKTEKVQADTNFVQVLSRSKRGIRNQRIRRMMMCVRMLKFDRIPPSRLPPMCRAMYCAELRISHSANTPSFCFPDRRVIVV